MQIPSSTYRVQLNKDFTFEKLSTIIDYLHRLGISTIYAAPILKSTKGSAHGYDVVDAHQLDPEIGTIEELRSIARLLRERNMIWLQDIVPNHMAFDTSNHRLMDVLERGPHSPFYNYFDINWNHPDSKLNGKVMVPFLGSELDVSIRDKHLQLSFANNGFEVNYYDTRYPLSLPAYEYLFFQLNTPETKRLRDSWKSIFREKEGKVDINSWKKSKTTWVESLTLADQETIREIIDEVNTNPQLIEAVLNEQFYVLSYWKDTEKLINYRRFFTVNQLICIRMEDDDVFDEYHSFLKILYDEGLIQGFRIDHIDGLQDPGRYISKLRELFGQECYIIAEKILEEKESMPADWQLNGTSGYEFLAHVNQLFTDRQGARQLLDFYKSTVPGLPTYSRLVAENKKMMLENYMAGEWDNLVQQLVESDLDGSYKRDRLKIALGALMVALPVYRIYPEELPLKGEALTVMIEGFEKARQSEPECLAELDHLFNMLITTKPDYPIENVLRFLRRLMQFTGPLTAKGVEDTTFYVYNPLISHDEVGDSPSRLGISINTFHRRMQNRAQSSPLSLNATATHDTKRGEDARIRLNRLTENADEWIERVQRWFEMNRRFSKGEGEKRIPHVNDEYFLYQSIVGGFPEDLVASEEWIGRLKEYFVKVLREAKARSSWEAPDEEYENGCAAFIDLILHDEEKYLPDAIAFMEGVTDKAMRYSLAQTLVKITAPGIPDIYQGCELWDLSYVDPDNRRPVDYDIRNKFLNEIIANESKTPDAFFSFLTSKRWQGIEKLFVTWKALNFRRQHPDLFNKGEYIPVKLSGSNPVACVFARVHQSKAVLVAVGFKAAYEMQESSDEVVGEPLVLLEDLPDEWTNLFTGKQIITNGFISVRALLSDFPVNVLYKV